MSAIISIIAAHDDNLGIGKNGKLPWHLSADLKRFKKITIGHPIIMGRKTFNSLGRVLPGRDHIVITRNPHLVTTPEWQSVNSLDQALKLAKSLDNQEIFIIGGGEIYNQALAFADKLYITHIKGNFGCDTFFPDYSNQFPKVISKQTVQDKSHHYTNKTLAKF